jgi:adenylate cyclase
MTETRKLAAILAADVVGFSRLASADEDRTLARLRALRSDVIDPTVAVHRGRVVKRTGDGAIVEFRSVVDAVRCATEIQNAMIERNSGLPDDQRIVFRIGVHVGDVVEEADGDLMGDGVNIAARLEGVARPGAICLSEDAYRQVSGRLDMEVTDLGPTKLKNIERPVRAYSLQVGVPMRAPDKRRSPALVIAVAVIALAVVAGGGAWLFLVGNPLKLILASAPPPAAAGPLSIVVLPFANLSGDPAQDYFADGVTDNLTTELSRIRHSFVIAHNTALSYKGKAIDAKEIGKALGVRYLLEGSVQRDQSRVRVNAQLIDAETGAHLWAEQFEEDVADLFKLQDLVVARLANTLGYELVKAEVAKNAGAKNPDAVDLVLRARALGVQAYRNPTKESFDAALAMYEKALAIDPREADALAEASMIHSIGVVFGVRPRDMDLEALALSRAEQAIALAPNSAVGYSAKALYLLNLTGKFNEAVSILDQGLAANPNSPYLYRNRGSANISLQHYEQAKSDILQGIRLSPRDPDLGSFYWLLGMAEFGLEHFEAAAEEENKALRLGYHPFQVYVSLAAAEAAQGRTSEAKAALEQARQIHPNLTIKYLLYHHFNIPGFYEALGKAGVPYE